MTVGATGARSSYRSMVWITPDLPLAWTTKPAIRQCATHGSSNRSADDDDADRRNTLVGVALPEGATSIDLMFHDPALPLGIWATCVALLMTLVWLGMA